MSTNIVHSKPPQIIHAPRSSQLDCPRLRLSLHLQVLVPPVPLLSSTAVTTYASRIRTSRNLMFACRKNLQRWLVT